MKRKNNIIHNISKRMSKRISEHISKHIRRTLICTIIGLSASMQTVYASSNVSDVMAPLDSMKTLIIAIIGAVGVIILAKNVMEFAQSYQQQDSSTMNSAIKGIVAGLLMSAISAVLTFLGF